jgi:hypothetical protein
VTQSRVAGSDQSVTSREVDLIDVERKYPNDLAERVRESWPADVYPLPEHLVTTLDVAHQSLELSRESIEEAARVELRRHRASLRAPRRR